MELQNGKIRLFRSVGPKELIALLVDGHVHGRYYLSAEPLTSSNLDKVICFFNDYTLWKDKSHKFMVCIEVDPDRILEECDSIWYVTKSFEKRRRVHAKKGPIKTILRESYLNYYDLKDIFSITSYYGFSELSELNKKYNLAKVAKDNNIQVFAISNKED